MRARNPQAGATFLFGPRSPRPDLLGAAQALVDDLRGDGQRVVSLRVNDQTLRLRLEGLELALALSAGPLPLAEMGGVLRRRPPPAEPAPDAVAELTDLTEVRLLRTIRQHSGAMGALLRPRGSGPDDPVDALRPILAVLADATTPSLILWQPTGVLWLPADFAQARRADLDCAGPALTLTTPRATARAMLTEATVSQGAREDQALGRAQRAMQRSAGHLFDRAGAPVPLPRLSRGADRLARALRDPAEAPETPAAPPKRRGAMRLAAGLATVLTVLALPTGGGGQATCAKGAQTCATAAAAAARQATKAASSADVRTARSTT